MNSHSIGVGGDRAADTWGQSGGHHKVNVTGMDAVAASKVQPTSPTSAEIPPTPSQTDTPTPASGSTYVWPDGRAAVVHKLIDGTEVVQSRDGSFQMKLQEALTNGLQAKSADNAEAPNEGSNKDRSTDTEDEQNTSVGLTDEQHKGYASSLNELGDAVSAAGLDEAAAFAEVVNTGNITYDDEGHAQIDLPDNVADALVSKYGDEAGAKVGAVVADVQTMARHAATQAGFNVDDPAQVAELEHFVMTNAGAREALMGLAINKDRGQFARVLKTHFAGR